MPAMSGLTRRAQRFGASVAGRRRRCNAALHRRELSSAGAAPTDWYDVTIVGGGPVGATVAASLATAAAARRMRIAILDAAPPLPPLPELADATRWTPEKPPEARAYALSPTSAEILQAIGVWGDVLARPVGRYEHMQVWDELGGGYVRLGGPGAGLGFIVEDSLLSGALWHRLAELADERHRDEDAGCLDLIRPAKVVSTVFPTDEGGGAWPSLELDDGRRFQTRLLVDATGGFSPIRNQAAFRTVGVDYNQRGVVATVALSDLDAQNATAWQRFLPTGPVALLPMGPGFANVVWSTNVEHAAQLMELGDEEFAATVAQAFSRPSPGAAAGATGGGVGGPLSALVSGVGSMVASAAARPMSTPPAIDRAVGRRGAFPLKLQHATSTVSAVHRLALVGDAAHVVHPLAGQGLNIGMYDAAGLVDSLLSAAGLGEDVGGAAALAAYERQRLASNTATAAGLHTMQRLMLSDDPLLVAARSLGMQAVDSIPTLRQLAVDVAAGRTQPLDLPNFHRHIMAGR